VRRGFLVTFGVIVIIAVAVFMWWLPAYRDSELQKQVEAIEAMEDLTTKKEAALLFLVENRMADREVLLRALDVAAADLREADDKEPLIALYQGLHRQNLTPWLRYRIIARLDRALIETEEAASAQKAEDLAREMLDVTDAPMEPYHWMVYFHQRSEHTDPELTLQVALAAERATDRDEYGMWGSMLDMAYRKLVGSVGEEQGLGKGVSRSRRLGEQTQHRWALVALNASV